MSFSTLTLHPLASAYIHSRIAQSLTRKDLAALCASSSALKACFQRFLYRTVHLRSLKEMRSFFSTILSASSSSPQANLVETLTLRHITHNVPLDARPYLKQTLVMLQHALARMKNLRYLQLFDKAPFPSALLTGAVPGAGKDEDEDSQKDATRFRLRVFDVSSMPWDTNLIDFLEGQSCSLTSVKLGTDMVPAGIMQKQITTSSFPNLTAYDGSAAPLCFFLSSSPPPPIADVNVHLDAYDYATDSQLYIKAADAVLSKALLPRLAAIGRTLQYLTIQTVPLQLQQVLLRSLCAHAPLLKGLGVIPIDCLNREDLHDALTCFTQLQTLEVDISSWNPPPLPFCFPSLAWEFRVYRPTLVRVTFVFGADIADHIIQLRSDDVWRTVHD